VVNQHVDVERERLLGYRDQLTVISVLFLAGFFLYNNILVSAVATVDKSRPRPGVDAVRNDQQVEEQSVGAELNPLQRSSR
jgi:hypothetical protein